MSRDDLSDFVDTAGKPNPRVGCWFSRLTAERQDKVTRAHAAGYNFVQIADTLTFSWDVPISAKAVGDHFRGQCRICR